MNNYRARMKSAEKAIRKLKKAVGMEEDELTSWARIISRLQDLKELAEDEAQA